MGSVEQVRENMKFYDVINPIITYVSDLALSDIRTTKEEVNTNKFTYEIDKDIFYLNSIVDKDGKNRFEEFMNKYFYNPLHSEILGKSNKKTLRPILLTTANKDGDGRHLEFNYYFILRNLLEIHTMDVKDLSCEELYKVVYDHFREQLRMTDEYGIKRLKSPTAKMVILRYLQTHGYNYYRPSQLSDSDLERFDKEITNFHIQALRNSIIDIIDFLRFLKKEMDAKDSREKGDYQDQMVKDFVNCFTYDKFLMCFMKYVLEDQKFCAEKNGIINNAFIELKQFFTVIDEENVKYNQSIKVYDKKKNKIVHFNTNDLRKEYEILNRRFKENFEGGKISSEQVKKMGLVRNQEKMDKYREFLSKEKQAIIETEFDILAPGEITKLEGARGYAGKKPNFNKTNKNIINEEEIEYRKFVLYHSEWSRMIVGKDKFEGYIGYIYPNCMVVFEKFKDKGGLKNNATYVMNIDDFVKFLEFMRLSKSEIIEYISDPNNKDVKRLYHNDTWADRLQALIGTKETTDETIMKVESLPLGGTRK